MTEESRINAIQRKTWRNVILLNLLCLHYEATERSNFWSNDSSVAFHFPGKNEFRKCSLNSRFYKSSMGA